MNSAAEGFAWAPTDEELIGYADIHCDTDLALFHRAHLNRLLALAGDLLLPDSAGSFFSMPRSVWEPIKARIRARQSGPTTDH